MRYEVRTVAEHIGKGRSKSLHRIVDTGRPSAVPHCLAKCEHEHDAKTIVDALNFKEKWLTGDRSGNHTMRYSEPTNVLMAG